MPTGNGRNVRETGSMTPGPSILRKDELPPAFKSHEIANCPKSQPVRETRALC
jgi:hypothetical protein